tara:strand:+ start:2506 stop:4230 length:1725 start_codon:yes stop_codon:yes gene_type:complete
MAIKFLHDLDLTGQELQNVKLHVTSSAPTAAAGAIYFDSGANVVKVHDGTSFKTLSTDTDDALNQYSTSVVSSSGVKLRLSGSGTSGNTTDDVEFAGSGTVSVARTNDSKITITGSAPSAGSASSLGTIKLFSDTTQTVAAESVSATNGRTYGLQVDSNGRGVVNIPWTDTDTNTQRAAGTGLSLSGNTLNANVDGTNSVAANSSSSTANRTYKIQVDSSDNLVVNVPWANTDTNTDTLQTISDSNSSSEQFVTFVANATGAQQGLSDPGIKYIPSSGTLKVTNLIVSGDTTTANETVKVIENNTLQFEGASGSGADDELNLTTAALSGDRTVTLADLSGHVALLAAAPGGTITATPAELNVLDGFAGATADLTYAKDLRATGVTTTEFDKLDGLTASTSELNILDGVTATTSEINILDGVTASTTEINLLDGITTLSGSNTGDEPDADTGTKGIVELATSAETQTGTDTGRAVTPDGLASRSVHATIDVSNSTFASGNQVAAIQHNLGTEDVIVQLFDSSTKETVYAVVERKTFAGNASTSTIRITFSSVPDNDVEVMITSIKGSTAKTPSYS